MVHFVIKSKLFKPYKATNTEINMIKLDLFDKISTYLLVKFALIQKNFLKRATIDENKEKNRTTRRTKNLNRF